ncbi:MAG TPA: cytochrome c3 family protein [Anaeromyxobacteraceae bacterium]|nr:cytochrome c3 family protein [Anaeromyxobacteraceae bacterium]
MKTRLLVVLLAALAAACANQGKKTEAAPPPPYKFPHSIHLEAGVACLECHSPIPKSTHLQANVIDVKLPTKSEVCGNCHDPIPTYSPVQRFEPAVNFDHAAHLPRVNGDCARCHVKFTEAGDTVKPVPPMKACTSCHQHAQDFAVGRCQPCHIDLKRFPYKPIAEYSHAANFLQEHGKWARQSISTCASCHDQTMCSQCHTATTRPLPPSVQFPEKVTADFIHRGDWISRHAMEQQSNPASCLRCHGPGYCESCHTFQGVAPGGSSTRDPHPSNWVGTHGPIARANIASCAACHNQGAASICVGCHAPGGVGGNPHPPGWKAPSGATSSNPTCRICHG